MKNKKGDHHPIMNWRRRRHFPSGRGLVKRSAIWSVVEIGFIVMSPFWTWSRKWWYLTAMCFVRGLIFEQRASSMAPALSSKTVDVVVVVDVGSLKIFCSSCKSCLVGSRPRIDCDNAMYSASTVDKATSDCNLEHHKRGVPQSIIT